MAKIVNNDVYLSPLEASTMLRVSYKTLQRWAETGRMQVWVGTNGHRRRTSRRVKIEYIQTPTGYRYYHSRSIEDLRNKVSSAA